jgi:hypothetical protein
VKAGSDVQHGAAQTCEHALLRSFLAAQRQAKLEEVLLAHGITDVPALARLTEEQLKKMGVAKGPRVKLLRTVSEWLPDATAPSETGYAAEKSAQQQGVDLAAALFTQAEQLAAGVAAPLTQPSHELSAATAMVGDKLQPIRTTPRVQPTTLSVRTAGTYSIAAAPGPCTNHVPQVQTAPAEQAVSDANIGKMVELGFDAELSKQALLVCGGELRSALEWALASGV